MTPLELDTQINKQVMGAIPCGGCSCIGRGDRPCAHDVFKCSHYPPGFSTSIQAAWQVVERLTLKIPNEFMLWQEHGQWAAEFQSNTTEYAPTAPLAICRAALAAVQLLSRPQMPLYGGTPVRDETERD